MANRGHFIGPTSKVSEFKNKRKEIVQVRHALTNLDSDLTEFLSDEVIPVFFFWCYVISRSRSALQKQIDNIDNDKVDLQKLNGVE